MIKKILGVILLFTCTFTAISQVTDTAEVTKKNALERESDSLKKIEEARLYKLNHTDFYVRRKGKLFGSFGLNQASYGRSNLTFWGAGYDFTVQGATAEDNKIGIQQHSFKLGYFITNHLSLSVSRDRMSYRFTPNQVATVNGEVEGIFPTEYNKIYESKLMEVKPEFLSFHHTELDCYFLELDYNDLFFETYQRKFAIDLVAGIGLGPVFTTSSVGLFETFNTEDKFQFSGFASSANVGLKFYLFKYIFIQPTVRAGYITLPDINIDGLAEDNASQNFTFFQFNTTLGFQFRLINK